MVENEIKEAIRTKYISEYIEYDEFMYEADEIIINELISYIFDISSTIVVYNEEIGKSYIEKYIEQNLTYVLSITTILKQSTLIDLVLCNEVFKVTQDIARYHGYALEYFVEWIPLARKLYTKQKNIKEF